MSLRAALSFLIQFVATIGVHRMSLRAALNYLQFSAFLAFLVPKQALILAVEFEIVLAGAATIDVFVSVLVGRNNENVFGFLQLFHSVQNV